MNNTTLRAIEMLTEAATIAGIANPEVFPAEPVSSYDGSQVRIGNDNINYFLRDDEPGRPWCLEITREDGTYDSHDGVTLARLHDLLRESMARVIAATPATFLYSPWRDGGWYVNNVRYPSGAAGCVSRNYPDKKWRIVCDKRETQPTFKTRDAAAAAEFALAGGAA